MSLNTILTVFAVLSGVVALFELLEYIFTKNIPWLARLLRQGWRRLTRQPNAAATLTPQAARAQKSVLMGLEGRGAKAYFGIFRAALNRRLTFNARTRRPPRDPVNALLSLGYTLLTANAITALEIVGLDPYCGFLHGLKAYGRPALALDLMEEFRPVIVDSVVLTLVNKCMATAKDFEPARPGSGGVYLTRRGLRTFFEQYTRRLNTTVYCPPAGRPLSYQKILEVQARRMARMIEGEVDDYTPFLVK
ncbi:MAG: CRISPR-associated endonuclease Cas1 [Anaerolineae bacterium]